MCFVHIANMTKKNFDLQNWQNNFRFTHKLVKKLPLKFGLLEEIMDLFRILLALMHLHFAFWGNTYSQKVFSKIT